MGHDWAWMGDGFLKLAVAARTSLEKPASLNSATGVKLVPSGAASRVMPSSSPPGVHLLRAELGDGRYGGCRIGA